jgi:alpha-glucosidase
VVIRASLLLVLLAGCSGPSQVYLSSDQAQVWIVLDPFQVHVEDASGNDILVTLGGGASDPYGSPSATLDSPTYQGQILPGWDGYVDGSPAWPHVTSAKLLHHSGDAASVLLATGDYPTTIAITLDGPKVTWEQSSVPANPASTAPLITSTVSFKLPEDEHFFGMGERFATSDHRGWTLYNWPEEGGLGGGETTPPNATNPYPNGPSMTYFPEPFFLSTKGYGARLDTTFRSAMYFGSERPDAWRFLVNHDQFTLTVYVSPNPLDIINDHTADTGRPRVPVPWAFGVHRRIDVNGMVNGVLEWQLMRQTPIPITGIDDSTHFLPASDQVGREAELQAWTTTLHANGFKVFAYNNPYVSASLAGGAADYATGVANNYFVKGPDGNPSLTTFSSAGIQQVAAIDFTSPAATTWFQSLLQRTLALGYDGWMHDFGEYTARDAVFSDGRTGYELHDLYPVLSAQAAAGLLNAQKPDSVFFTRSGYIGTQQYAPITWSGDAEADFDDTQGLPSAVRGGINLSMSGQPYWGSDVTGYKCIDAVPHDKEMFIRWVELATVSPWWKEENACANPLMAETKWSLWDDAETISTYAQWASLHTRLQPYFLVLAQLASTTGQPLTMHPFLLDPQNPSTWAVDDAFYLGPALFAAPVVRRGQTWKDTWLPAGRFVDLYDYTVFTGGTQVQIVAPLDKLPLLLKEEEVLPMLDPSIQTLAPATVSTVVTPDSVSDRLDVVVALSVGGTATLTLVDGTVLTASRGATDNGNPANLQGASSSQIADCALCYLVTPTGDVSRLQANSSNGTSSEVVVSDLDLKVQGGPSRRVRWDILRLP